MITLNYQAFGAKGFNLRLRLYQDGETKYITVTKMLKGSLRKAHWNSKKQQFIPSAPFSEENNLLLVKFRQKYDEAVINWNGSVFGLITYMEQKAAEEPNVGLTLQAYLQSVIEELKSKTHADGTVKGTYESYVKLDNRLMEWCRYKRIKYERILLTDVNPAFVNSFFDWVVNVRKGKGHVYLSSMFHAVIVRADKAGHLKWDDFKNCNWKAKNRSSAKKYYTLSADQCRRFIGLTTDELPKNPKSELYRDFCTFILLTGQSPRDAIALTYLDIKNIGGVDHFIFNRRKISEKQSVPCQVPISDELREIMNRWKSQSKDGFIFPIRNKHKLATQTTNNGDIKHFIGRLNNWLKKIAKILGCTFSLSSYTFRHTAITRYISKGVPIIYVANMMGTSVDNCEKIYYNNQGDVASRNKVMSAMMF